MEASICCKSASVALKAGLALETGESSVPRQEAPRAAAPYLADSEHAFVSEMEGLSKAH
jgi:hypothetical protein